MPHMTAYNWVKNEDGTPAVLWRPYLQCGAYALSLSMNFTSRKDCEQFIREEILTATFGGAG